MLNALMQLVGLAPRDRREVWHEKPLVIVNDDGDVIYSDTATIEYAPSEESYERGHAEIFDEIDGGLVLSVDIVAQRTYSTLSQSNPAFWARRSRLGLTAKAVDSDGNRYTLYVGRHAHGYMLRGSTLDDGTTAVGEFLDDEPAE